MRHQKKNTHITKVFGSNGTCVRAWKMHIVFGFGRINVGTTGLATALKDPIIGHREINARIHLWRSALADAHDDLNLFKWSLCVCVCLCEERVCAQTKGHI